MKVGSMPESDGMVMIGREDLEDLLELAEAGIRS